MTLLAKVNKFFICVVYQSNLRKNTIIKYKIILKINSQNYADANVDIQMFDRHLIICSLE
ncbi:hypothetical protein NIES2101_42800 [Calothrix sp. HK-06]|nr:hypothetical protein NIES2101_42800 [Calothrix sp. HK-06]